MGKEQETAFYDDLSQTPAYNKPTTDSGWIVLWRAAAEFVKKNDRVLDLGCGVGHMAEVLRGKCRQYHGVDFSEATLEKARKRHINRTSDSSLRWIHQDLRLATPSLFKTYDVILMLEFLEHINDDLDLIAKFPSRQRVVITVPSFDDPGHVRYFGGTQEVTERYSHAIKVKKVKVVHGNWFLLAGKTL